MHRIDTDGNVAGQFTEGDPTIPQEATIVSAAWLNAVQGEIVAVIEGAGLTLNKANNAQLLAALNARYGQLGAANTWAGANTFGAVSSVSFSYSIPRVLHSYTDATALYAGPTTTGLVLGTGANYWGSNAGTTLTLAGRINCPSGVTIQAVEFLASNSDAAARAIDVYVYGRDGSGAGMTSSLYTSPDGDTTVTIPGATATAEWRSVPLAVSNPVLPSNGYLGIYCIVPVTSGAASVKVYAVRVRYAMPDVRPGI